MTLEDSKNLELNAAPTPSIETIRVLHIDDDEDQQMFLKVFIESDKNIKVTSPRNAADTIELVETGAYDCLISDYDMPDMDGITLAKKIRKTSNIPIIIYTGRGSEEVAERAFEAGVDDYIRKETAPAHYQIVSKRIRQAVERRRSSDSYRSLFESANDTIFLHTLDGTIIDINEAGCKRLGYPKNELLGKSLGPHVSPQGIRFKDNMEKLVKQGHAIFESEHIKRGGELIPVEVNAKVIKYMGSDVVLSFSRDITDRKRLEAQMKERLEALQSHALALGQCEDVYAVAKTTYQILHETMGYGFFGLGIVEGDAIKFILNKVVENIWSVEYPLDGPGVCVRAVKTGSTIIVPDVRLDSEYVGPKTGYIYLSEIMVPAKIGGRVVAVINVEDEKLNRFTRDDATLLEVFSEHVASALHRIGLIDSTRRYLSRIEKINKHATHLAHLNTVKEVAEYSFDVLQELGFTYGCLGIVEEYVLKFKYARNLAYVTIPDLPLNKKGITIRTVRTGESQLVQDTRLDVDFVSEGDPVEYLSELDVPVKVDNRVVAVINLEDRKPGFFSVEDREIVEILAEHVASAFSRIEQHEAIRESGEALVKSEERFKYILDSAPEGVAVNVLTKLKYVNKHFADMIGYTVDELLQKNIVELHPEKYQKMIKDRTQRRARGEEVPTEYEVELIRKDGSIIPVEYSISRIVFNGENASLTFIRDISQRREKVALDKKIASLHQHSRVLNELGSIDDAAQVTLDILSNHLNCNFLSFQLAIDDYLHIVTTKGVEPIGAPMPIQGKGVTARAAREKKTILVQDTREDPDFIKLSTESLSELATPILCTGEVLGVLNAELLEVNGFSDTDRILMETLADEVGATIMRIKRDEGLH